MPHTPMVVYSINNIFVSTFLITDSISRTVSYSLIGLLDSNNAVSLNTLSATIFALLLLPEDVAMPLAPLVWWAMDSW